MISTKGRYALRVMMELAQQNSDAYISLGQLAAAQHISENYVSRIMSELSKADLVDAVQGKNGGYRLKRPLSAYSLGDIMRASGEKMEPVSCVAAGSPGCEKQGACKTYPVWQRLDNLVQEYLDSVTLEDLMNEEGADQ